MHADLQRLLSDDLLVDLPSRPIERLRQLRAEATQAENDVSFVRRMTQGRLDIVGHERKRRTAGSDPVGEPPDTAGLLYDMPDILKDTASGGSARNVRHIEVNEPGDIAIELGEQLDQIASPATLRSVDQLSDADLADLLDRLEEFEGGLSTTRRSLHDRIDAFQNEVGRRYRAGELTVDTVLNQDRD